MVAVVFVVAVVGMGAIKVGNVFFVVAVVVIVLVDVGVEIQVVVAVAVVVVVVAVGGRNSCLVL